MFALIALLTAMPADAQAVSHAMPNLLVDQQTLVHLMLDDERPVVLLDVRARQDFAAGAIPTAQHVDVAAWKAAFGDGSDAEAWGKRIGELGISADATVVIYDKATTPKATRLWWLLKYWGVADVRVLDGGYGAWTPPGPAKRLAPSRATEFVAKPQAERLFTRGQVMQAIAGDSAGPVCLIDTRSTKEHNAGRIPTASNSDWTAYVDAKTGKLRPPAELRALLDAAGIDPEKPVVTYCNSGGRASLVALVAELVTGKPAANYWGSWNEWSKQADD